MSKKNGHWQVKSTDLKYENPWMKVYEDSVTDVGGVDTTFSYIWLKDGISVLPIDDDGNVFLIETNRYATYERSIECVSGGIRGKEKPLEIAKRELAEELGLSAEKWRNVGFIHTFPDKLQHTENLFIARCLKKIPDKPQLDSSEEVTIMKVPYRTALEWVMASKITHGPSCVLILKASLLLLDEGCL